MSSKFFKQKKTSLQRYAGDMSDNDSSGEDLFKNPDTKSVTDSYNVYEQDPKRGSVAPTARLNNPIMLQRVKNALQAILRRRLTFGEIASLRNFIDMLPAAKLAHYNDIDIEKKIVSDWLKGQKAMNNEDGLIDTHELLKKNIGLNSENDVVNTSINKVQYVSNGNDVNITSILGNNDTYGIQRIVNPQSLYTQTQILLDSRWRSFDTDGTTLFKWSFSNTVAALQGTFNTTSPVRDIISIKVLPFKIPYSFSAENSTKNITMYFNEFSNQCVIAQEGRKYHHWFEYTKEDDWLSLDAKRYNGGVYNFDKPITTLDTLTVSFGSPLQIIQFDIDRMNATFTIGSPTTLTFPSTHNLTTGNTIYFTNFITTNSGDFVITNQVNTLAGLEVTRVDATTITIAVDSSAMIGVPNSPVAFFGEKRIYIPIEITYIRPKV